MDRKTLVAIASIAASVAKIVTVIQNKKEIEERRHHVQERNNRVYRNVLDDMSRTRSVTDKVLNGEYGTDFGRAIRDIRVDRKFGQIVHHFDD
jgi:hypothetical protein